MANRREERKQYSSVCDELRRVSADWDEHTHYCARNRAECVSYEANQAWGDLPRNEGDELWVVTWQRTYREYLRDFGRIRPRYVKERTRLLRRAAYYDATMP